MDSFYDVIIVLGAAVRKGGVPSSALRRRLLHGVWLMKQKKAGYLLVTGGTGRYPPAEACVMKQLALEQGIEPERIITEEKATNTFESAKLCISIMRRQKWNSALVVSDPYHLPRSVFLFRCLGIRASGSGAKGGRGSNTLLKWWYYHLREVLAFAWYVLLICSEKIKMLK